jgi:hypothetical protein
MIDLVKVRANFDRRAQHFLTSVALLTSGSGKSPREIDREVSHIIIELESALAYASRSAYLAGSVGGRSAAGARLRGIGVDAVSALTVAARAVGKKGNQIPGRDEPSWSSATNVATVAAVSRPSNEADIISAMGVFPGARKCVKSFRHFFAHRNEDTLKDARLQLGTEYGLVWKGHPTPALLRLSVSGGGSLLETWIWNYVDVVHALC